jgi:pimeloyl-ACP methyl ester carboxylesterase
MKPTIVLVHGAFAESSSWDGVIPPLIGAGHRVIAAANPLRGLAGDLQAVADLVGTIGGPIVLVGHSYGGSVIANVPAAAGDITGLVFVAAFAPDSGESVLNLSAKYPGSTLGDTLRPVPRSDGATDLYIAPDLFPDQFCADVPADVATRMAVTQRPVTHQALSDRSGAHPLWRERPSWFLFGDTDLNIPAALQRFMAKRADARQTLEIPGGSHALAVSQPEATVGVILEATALRAAA